MHFVTVTILHRVPYAIPIFCGPQYSPLQFHVHFTHFSHFLTSLTQSYAQYFTVAHVVPHNSSYNSHICPNPFQILPLTVPQFSEFLTQYFIIPHTVHNSTHISHSFSQNHSHSSSQILTLFLQIVPLRSLLSSSRISSQFLTPFLIQFPT